MSAPTDPNATRRVSVAVALAAALVASACDDSSPVKETLVGGGATPAVDAGAVSGTGDAGATIDGGAKDCFDDPKTHFEIINACTTATRIAKSPALTKLLPDGGLPPLP